MIAPYMLAIYLMMFSVGGVFGYQIINAQTNYERNRQLPTAENTQNPKPKRVALERWER